MPASALRAVICASAAFAVADAAAVAMGLDPGLEAELSKQLPKDPRPPDYSQCQDITVHDWVREAISHSTAELAEKKIPQPVVGAAKCAEAADWFPPEPPVRHSQSKPIPRISVKDLSSSQYYWYFVRGGFPVILTDVFKTDPVWWQQKQADVVACADHADKEMAASASPEYDPSTQYITSCRSEAEIDASHLPAALTFSSPLTPPATIASSTAPYVLRATEGFTFGSPAHYDLSCDGMMSVQYAGLKSWNLWAPWNLTQTQPVGSDFELNYIARHTRFEGIVRPGEMLLYGPAWFHSTNVIKGHGHSVAAAYSLYDIPFFGASRGASLSLSPFGFGVCAASTDDSSGWADRSLAWEKILGDLGAADTLPAASAYRTINTQTTGCETFCEMTPCSELQGNPMEECGECPTYFVCHREKEEL